MRSSKCCPRGSVELDGDGQMKMEQQRLSALSLYHNGRGEPNPFFAQQTKSYTNQQALEKYDAQRGRVQRASISLEKPSASMPR